MKSKRLFISFVLNFIFTIFEFVGGVITNSIALISDSIHDLGDSISIGLAIFLEKKAEKKPDQLYTYGYKRYSLLGGFISSFILVIGSVFVLTEAIPRMLNPEPIDSLNLIWFAVVGVIINGIAAINANKGSSISEKVISLHLFEDVLGWIALLIGAFFMHFFQIFLIDSILSILFTLYILTHVLKNIRQIFQVFLEKAPMEPTYQLIEQTCLKNPNIQSIHHVHHWSLEGENSLITMHAVLKKEVDLNQIIDIKNDLHHHLHEIGIMHSTIEFEVEGEDCLDEDCLPQPSTEKSHHHHHHH